MNKHDEELQRRIESGSEPIGDELDIAIYRSIFKNLKNNPPPLLSDNFTDVVIARVLAKKQQRTVRDFVWLGVGVFMLIVAGVAGVVFSGLRYDISVYKQVAGIGGLVLFALAFSALLNLIDRKVVSGKLESF